MDVLIRLTKDENGQGMAEYTMILLFIAMAAMFGYMMMGTALSAKVNDIGNQI